jgi:hypothetical protein
MIGNLRPDNRLDHSERTTNRRQKGSGRLCPFFCPLYTALRAFPALPAFGTVLKKPLFIGAVLVPGARHGQPPRDSGCRSLCSLGLYRPRSGHPTAAAKPRPPRRRLPASDEVRWGTGGPKTDRSSGKREAPSCLAVVAVVKGGATVWSGGGDAMGKCPPTRPTADRCQTASQPRQCIRGAHCDDSFPSCMSRVRFPPPAPDFSSKSKHLASSRCGDEGNRTGNFGSETDGSRLKVPRKSRAMFH